MAEYCTLFCRNRREGEALAVLRSVFDKVVVEGAEDAWTAIRAAGTKGELRLNAMVYRERGDEFTSLLFKTYLFAENQMVAAIEDQRETVLDQLANTELIIGVVAEPSFDADPRYQQVVSLLATTLNALIFNGTELLNAFGEVVMYPEE
jgi:hypothetical protein